MWWWYHEVVPTKNKTIRFPEEIEQQIQEFARAERRSFTGQLLQMVQESIEARGVRKRDVDKDRLD